MTDEEALFAAIRAHPDEDTPRLAYADWLDEHLGSRAPAPVRRTARPPKVPAGSAADRAEFIRVECELARLEQADPSPEVKARAKELVARRDKLLRHVEKAWEAPFRNGRRFAGPAGFTFFRGLPHGVPLDNSQALAHGEALLRQSPVVYFWLREVSAEQFNQLLGAAWLPLLARLSVEPQEGRPPDLAQFADPPYLDRLDYLRMYPGWALTPDGADRLARSAALPVLRTLELYRPAGGAAGFGRLFAGSAFRSLTELIMRRLPFAEGELATILGSPALAALEQLSVLGASMRRADWDALARSPMWPNLRWLTLPGPAGPAAEALEAAPPGRLERLSLFHGLSDHGAAALARWPVWHSLRTLELGWNRDVTPAGWVDLVRATAAGAIRDLSLSHTSVDDRVAREIADAPHLAGLRALNLKDTAVTDAGARALAASSHLGRLRRLEISIYQVGPAVRRQLRKRFGDAIQF